MRMPTLQTTLLCERRPRAKTHEPRLGDGGAGPGLLVAPTGK